VSKRLEAFLTSAEQPEFKSRQIEMAPVGAAAVLTLVGAWLLISTGLRAMSHAVRSRNEPTL
jgi:hypothetical protein